MSRTIFASAAALALLTGAPAVAAKSQSTESATGATSGKKAERKTCRTFQNTATRMRPERICLTREGWKKFDAQQ